MATYASQVIATAAGEVGYCEKASNAQLESKTANAGHNNYTKYANYFDTNYPNFYNGPKNGFDWCDMFVDYCFVKTFGVDTGRALLCQPLQSAGAGCIYSYGYYKAKGQVGKTPKVGAQIFFGSSEGTLYHTGIVEKFDSNYVYTIEGNTSDVVARRTYSRTGGGIFGYGYPAYTGETAPGGSNTSTNTDKPSDNTTTNNNGSPSKTIKFTGYAVTQVTPRSWAGSGNSALKTVGNIKKGDTVSVCDTVKAEDNTNWYYVLIEKKAYGFVPASSISKTKPTDNSVTNTNGTLSKTVDWTGTVTADALNVRTWAGTEYNTLKSVPMIYNGTKVGVCDSVKAKDGSTWYYVLINNSIYGFVHSDYIKR